MLLSSSSTGGIELARNICVWVEHSLDKECKCWSAGLTEAIPQPLPRKVRPRRSRLLPMECILFTSVLRVVSLSPTWTGISSCLRRCLANFHTQCVPILSLMVRRSCGLEGVKSSSAHVNGERWIFVSEVAKGFYWSTALPYTDITQGSMNCTLLLTKARHPSSPPPSPNIFWLQIVLAHIVIEPRGF